MKQTIIIVFVTFLGLHCGNALKVNLTNQPPKPDLIIKSVHSRRIALPEPENPKRLGGVVAMPPGYEFTITIENIGAGEWWGDFYIRCDYFSSPKEKILDSDFYLNSMEESTLPFKESMSIILPTKILISEVARLLFTINPIIQDSTLISIENSKEFFYHNNTYEINL